MTFKQRFFQHGLFKRGCGLAVTLMIAGVILFSWQSRGAAASAASLSPEISTFQQINKLTANDGQAQDRFGNAVAVSEDGRTVAIGAPGDDLGASPNQGSVYIYERQGASFVFSQQLFTGGGSEFGASVAIDGDTMIVGSPGEQTEQGALYIFVKQNGTWQQQQRLVANDGAANDHLGFCVAISGNTVLAGAYGADINGQFSQGAAYSFKRTGTVWSQELKFIAFDGAQPDVYGYSVALDGDTAAIGAAYDQVGNNALQGSVYTYQRSGGVWAFQQKLTATDGAASDGFGTSLDLEGNTLLVGAWMDSSFIASNHGSAYVFQRTGNIWSQQDKLLANDQTAGDFFGNAVALDGDIAVVGAYYKNVNGNSLHGATYTFTRSGTVWSQDQRFTGSGGASAYMGGGVALAGQTLASGAFGEGTNKGAVYVYRPPNHAPQITPQANFVMQAGNDTQFFYSIANVSDQDQAPNTLQVLVEGGASATKNGVTISNMNINAAGQVMAIVTTSCSATDTFFVLRIVDDEGAFNTAIFQIHIAPNAPPTLSYNLAHFVSAGGMLTINPTSGPSDNGGLNFVTLQSVTPTFTGDIIVLPTGVVSILNAGPVGTYSVTIRAVDMCGLGTNASFSLTVNNSGGVSANNLQFYPLAHPVRLLDTRVGAAGCDAPNAKIAGGTSRTQTAAGRTCDGLAIPANAAALVGNATSVQSGGGYFTLYPSDIAKPNSANSNYAANQILNSLFTVRLGASDGAFKIFASTDTDIVVDITGYYAPPSATGLYFHPLPKPVRLLDTRPGASACFTPGAPLQGNTDTSQIGTTTCDGVLIPAGALALTGNATTVSPQANGFLTLYPSNSARPLIASANFQPGVNLNSPFMVGLSPSGQFNIYVASTTDLVVDVTGYYSTQLNDSNGPGLLFNALSGPTRLLDTRAGQQACFTPSTPMTGGTAYLQTATGACSHIPAAAQAVVGNATAINATANGYLTFWPSNANQPFIATSNYRTGITFNRHFTVGLGADGAFKRFAASTTDLVIDVTGFFAP